MAAFRTLGMAMTAGALILAVPAAAQQPAKPAPAPAATPANKAGAGTKASGSAWVKLCEKQKGGKKGSICLIHHERFHPTTGQPLVSAAVRKIDGQKQETFMVMVPLGRLLRPGLILKVDKEKPVKIGYSFCTSVGCVAETPATPELLSLLKKGKNLAIGTIDINQKRIGFQVPMDGFASAYAGPPIDRKIYAQARKEMFQQIRARQVQMLKRAKAEAQKKKAGAATAPAPKKAP